MSVRYHDTCRACQTRSVTGHTNACDERLTQQLRDEGLLDQNWSPVGMQD